MKKRFFLASLCIATLLSGCKSEFFSEKLESTNNRSVDERPKPRKKLKFKHDGCAKPIGICVQIPIGRVELTNEELEDDIAYATLSLETPNILKIAPERNIYLQDGSVPVSNDIELLNETAKEFRLKYIRIKAGNYSIDFTENKPYGVVRVKAETVR